MSKNTKWFKRAVAVILSVCFVVSVTAFAYLGDLSGDVSANSENSEINYIKKEATILKKLGGHGQDLLFGCQFRQLGIRQH